MPVVHELLHQSSASHPSERSSPSKVDHQSSSPRDQPIATLDRQSSSSRLSRPSKLSDENLQRQFTGVKDRVKKSTKLRETERWARETASSSLHSSPNHPSQSSSSPMMNSAQVLPHPIDSQDPNLSVALHPSSNIHATATPNTLSSPSPETLPRPRISVQPVPSFRAIPTTEPASDNMILSEHASINDWHSENTNATYPAGTSPQAGRTLFPLSPIDVQIVAQTPTGFDFQSLNNRRPPTVLAGTVIGPVDESASLPASKIISLQLSPFPPPSVRPPSPQSPRIREIPLTPTSRGVQDVSDPLLKARIILEEALSTTPQARTSSNPSPSSPSPSPVRNFHSRPIPPAPPFIFQEGCGADPEEEEEDDEDEDDESGLSPIKEDRTAELAAEHSWRIRHMLGPQSPIRGSLVQPSNCFDLLGTTHHSNSSQPSRPLNAPISSKSESSTSSAQLEHQAKACSHDRGISVEAESTETSIPVNLIDDQETSDNKHENLRKVEANGNMACLLSNDDERASHNTVSCSALSSDDVLLQNSQPPESNQPQPNFAPSTRSPNSTPCQTERLVRLPSSESISSRRQAPPLSVRTTSLQKPNPPLSVPASARRPPPADALNRLEMEEWRSQTGIDDRYSLSLRATSSALTSGTLGTCNGVDVDRAGLFGLGAEERRGIKDRWGNSWGLEAHVLSPLSERTERSLTTAGSILSLSTRKSSHSLRSLDSTSTSIAQRLEQAESNTVRMMKFGSGLVPSGVVRVASTGASNPTARSVSCTMNRIDSPTKLSPFKADFHNDPPHLLIEEKLKRKEERRLKREKREKRRAEELKSSESLAQKQERRRQEKRKKEEFLDKKHQILLRLQECGEDPRLIRDLGILYMTSNVGVAGLKLAIRHLETSLQMCDSDALAWSYLGKAWAQLHGIPEAELAKLPDPQEANKAQQAHNATIGLRKAIINSRTPADALKYKVEWARYLEKMGRWHDSLGVIGEVIKHEGKQQPRCWAALGFIGLRIVFGWPPLNDLEADDLDQGFQDDMDVTQIPQRSSAEGLSDSDRIKLLSQVHHAFERALILIDEQAAAQARLSNPGKAAGGIHYGAQIEELETKLKAYKKHYENQLKKVEMIERGMGVSDCGIAESSNCHAGHAEQCAGANISNVVLAVPGEMSPSDGIDGLAGPSRVIYESRGQQSVHVNDEPSHPPQESKTTQDLPHNSADMVTEEVHECQSSLHSSPSRSTTPICRDPEPTTYADLMSRNDCAQILDSEATFPEQSRSVHPADGGSTDLEPVTIPKPRQISHSREMTGADYLSMATSPSHMDLSSSLARENHDTRTPVSETYHDQETKARATLKALPDTRNLHTPMSHSYHLSTRQTMLDADGSSDGPELIVQYDDVDTTNDYSDSRNSDPFRPPSTLGHFLPRQSAGVGTNCGPPSEGLQDPSVADNPIRSNAPQVDHSIRLCQSRQSSPPSVHPASKPASLGDLNTLPTRDEQPLPLESLIGPTGHPNSCKDYQPQFSPRHDSERRPSLTETSSSVPHSVRSMSAIQPPPENYEFPRCSSSNSSRDIKPSLKSPTHNETQAHVPSPRNIARQQQQSADLACSQGSTGLGSRNVSSPFSSDQNYGGLVQVDDGMRKMCLNSIVSRKLNEIDKEKVIAFFELDSSYHSKVSRLRKKLLKIEEEREIKRKEMYDMLGIKELCDSGENDYQTESLVGREGETDGGGGPKVGSEGGGSSQTELGDDRGESIGSSKIELRERNQLARKRLPSSFCSVRSASLLPTHHHDYDQYGRPVDRNEGGSRVFSPNPIRGRSPSRGRALSLGGPVEYQNRTKTAGGGGEFSCTSTAVAGSSQLGCHVENLNMLPPSSNESGQANIALQGIAAILKLATSAQATS